MNIVEQGILSQGNSALRDGEYEHAISLFESFIAQNQNLAQLVKFNLEFARQKLQVEKSLRNEIATASEEPIIKTVKSSELPLKIIGRYEGRLEHSQRGSLKGWAVNIDKKAELFELKVMIDGLFFCSIKNSDNRADLQRAGKSKGKGGYSLQIPADVLNSDSHLVSIIFPDGCILSETRIEGAEVQVINDITLLPVDEKLSVIVPIYNAVDDVKVCIERLVEYTSKDVDIILINDASPDPAIQPVLELAMKLQNIRVFHNEVNLGFTKTVNRGIKLAGTNDVVLLNSDARVTPRWIEGFRRALATDHKIATVTAMSDRAGAFSAPNIGNDNNLPQGVSEVDYAVAFRRRSAGSYPTVPTGNGFCMYIRRKCIDELGCLDAEAFPRGYGEENDFCMRARANGWRNVIDDRTYVFHDRSKSFGGEKDELIKAGRSVIDSRYPDYKKATAIFAESPLINLARFRARKALEDCKAQVKPRGLYVISTLTGGTPQTNRDLMLAVADKVEGWLLHCDRKILSLYRVFVDAPDQLIRQVTLREPVDPLTHHCAQYDRVVANWLAEYDFDYVHIRHLAWHSLSLPKLAKQAGARVINSFHDFYAVCPTVKLLDENNKFCEGVCTKRSDSDCKPDLWGIESLPPLKDAWVNTWRAKFVDALKYCDIYITTHESVRETILARLPLDAEKFFVIPHGRNFDTFDQLAAPFKDGEELRILVPGNVSVPKGSKIIEELLRLDLDGKLHFHVLGKSNLTFKHPRLTFHGEYKREQFAEHVAKVKPHVGAVFSIWNETWCHTLTEMWSVGVPVMVTDYATLRSRVLDSGCGWVIEGVDTKQMYEFILGNIAQSSTLPSVVKNVVDMQSRELKDNSTYYMAQQYVTHYKIE